MVIPLATTLVMLAVWPTSVRSASVKTTGILAVSTAVFVCSFKAVSGLAIVATGSSLVPVMVIVKVLESLAPSSSVTVQLTVMACSSPAAKD